MKYLVIIADLGEYVPFIEGLSGYAPRPTELRKMPACALSVDGNEVFAVCSGIGKVNAAATCAIALSEGSYDAVISLGYSGGVSKVTKDDIIAGASYVECDFDLTPIGYLPGEKTQGAQYVHKADKKLLSAAEKAGIRSAALGTGDFFLTDSARRDLYIKLFSINAFDMESGALANVCALLDTPFLAVRKISDSADDTAGTDYRETLNGSETAFSEILVSLLKAI